MLSLLYWCIKRRGIICLFVADECELDGDHNNVTAKCGLECPNYEIMWNDVLRVLYHRVSTTPGNLLEFKWSSWKFLCNDRKFYFMVNGFTT